jgi:C4-dicarboxylate transporter/malic acid transport protein
VDLRTVVRHFSPAWFALVMGTGGVASLVYAWAPVLGASFLKEAGLAFAALAGLLFLLLLVPWLGRWFLHTPQATADLQHPLLGNFYVTMPVAVMVLVLDADQMLARALGPGWVYGLTLAAWLFGVGAVTFLSIYVSYNVFRQDGAPARLINPAWLLAPVAAIVIPLLGDPLTGQLLARHSPWAATVDLIDMAFTGMGLALFVVMLAFVVARLIQHALPPADAAPTFWITLGPIGVGAVALLDLANLAPTLHLTNAAGALIALAVLLWGFGVWAIGVAIAVTAHYLRRDGIPFTLSFWAFTFPLAVYATASLRLQRLLHLPGLELYSGLLAALLIVLWGWALVGSVDAALTGTIWAPPRPGTKEAPPHLTPAAREALTLLLALDLKADRDRSGTRNRNDVNSETAGPSHASVHDTWPS